MPVYHQVRKVKSVYHQGRRVKEIWHMGRKIYTPSKPVEVIPSTPGYSDAKNWLRATVQKYGLDYTTVRELPFDIDSRNATKMLSMFDSCSSLTTAPQMDTSNVTNMVYMFFGCSSLTKVPDMDTSNVIKMNYMFSGCSSLTDGNVRLIGKNPQVDTSYMISNSGLTREPFYRTDGTPIN